MKAAVFYGPERVRIEETVRPSAASGEVLVRIFSCGICGSDVKIYRNGHKAIVPPRIFGHEAAGEIAAIGEGVSGYAVGQRVLIGTEIGCGRCDFCYCGTHNLCTGGRKAIGYAYDGAFAGYLRMPARGVRQGNLIPMPDRLRYDRASLVEPLACVINAHGMLHIHPGETVVVLGGGTMGALHLLLARTLGAGRVIVVSHGSRKRAALMKRFAPDIHLFASREDPVRRVMRETGGRGADVIITACSAAGAQTQAVAMAAIRGRVCFYGGVAGDSQAVSLDTNAVHYRELTVVGAFSASRHHYVRALNLIASGKVDLDPLVTHRIGLEDLVEGGIRRVMDGEAMKVMVEIPQ